MYYTSRDILRRLFGLRESCTLALKYEKVLLYFKTLYFDFEFNVQEHSNLNVTKEMLSHHGKVAASILTGTGLIRSFDNRPRKLNRSRRPHYWVPWGGFPVAARPAGSISSCRGLKLPWSRLIITFTDVFHIRVLTTVQSASESFT